ncbi:MAG: response regulator [Tissierellales bacterium]|nr:response regulator [Tissierellales bacterium]MBN2828205.1 response regulator [Tissierellales bacterium]
MISILVVDDEKITREYIKYVFNEKKMEAFVIEAVDGLEGIIQFKKYHPEIVIMDIHMPNKNGLEAAEEIRKLNKETIILVLTAYTEFEYAQRALKNKADDYLLKPISPEHLIQCIEPYLEGRRTETIRKNEEEYSCIAKTIEESKVYIETRLKEKISLIDVATYFGYSPYYFSKAFNKFTGMNLNAYINLLRIEESKKMMRDRTLSLQDISQNVGFDNYNYFCKVFKKTVGVLPSEFRKNS